MWAGQFYSRGTYTIFHHTLAESATSGHFRPGYSEKHVSHAEFRHVFLWACVINYSYLPRNNLLSLFIEQDLIVRRNIGYKRLTLKQKGFFI